MCGPGTVVSAILTHAGIEITVRLYYAVPRYE